MISILYDVIASISAVFVFQFFEKLQMCLCMLTKSHFSQNWLLFKHRQSKEWTGNAGKIANVADATSVIWPDMLYCGYALLWNPAFPGHSFDCLWFKPMQLPFNASTSFFMHLWSEQRLMKHTHKSK